jgi:hypothetical protein
MRTYITAAVVLLALVATPLVWADGTKYKPGGPQFSRVWHAFYTDEPHESELPAPLVAAGPKMTAAICDAVVHKDMMYRRYAIAALGIVHDRRAIPTLETIMRDESELDYFRGDALQSLFRIDRGLGRRHAKQYAGAPDYLQMVARAIDRNEAWLTAPWGRH